MTLNSLFFLSSSLFAANEAPLLVTGTCVDQSILLQSPATGVWQVGGTAPSNGTPNNITCDSSVNCVAVSGGSPAVVSTSEDNGKTWTSLPVTNLPSLDTTIVSLFCEEQSLNPILCIAAGYFTNGNNSTPLLISNMSNSSEGTWQAHTSFSNINTSVAHANNVATPKENISCNVDTCLVMGNYYDSSNSKPFGIVTDGWFDWGGFTLPVKVTNDIFINSSHCVDKQCIAGGSTNNQPILTLSQDGGKTWNAAQNFMPAGAANGVINYVKCKGSSCLAIGLYGSPAVPFSTTSDDGGQTWTPSTNIATWPTNGKGVLSQVASCNDTVCVAAHELLTSSIPSYNTQLILMVSNDYGKSWVVNQVANLPTGSNLQFNLSDAYCNSNSCIIVGDILGRIGNSVDSPLLIYSQDATWNYAAITGLPANKMCKLLGISRPIYEVPPTQSLRSPKGKNNNAATEVQTNPAMPST